MYHPRRAVCAIVCGCLTRDRRGSVALLGLIAMTSILGMAGFAIDLGSAYLQQARLQKVADSAAMAGAMSWSKSGSTAAVTATVKAIVLANGWPATAIQTLPAYLAHSPRNSANPAVQVGLTAPSGYGFLRAITTATSTTTTAYAAVELGSATGTVTTLFNSGVNASGAVIAGGVNGDPHWVFITVPPGSSSVVQVGATGTAFYWTGSGAASAWIAPVGGNGNMPGGWYIYRTTFDLTGFDPSTMQIAGQADADDSLYLVINGAISSYISTNASYYGSANFTIASGFVSGLNTLDFYVYNNTGATGMRVEMTGTAARGGRQMLVQ